ncbi:NAD(P)-dependent oxidoreductase [Calidifontibacter sp. DB0510]|uniref:NAD(P)-dependent oxidoreductase n=1 Tax=Metallococcus carri TaxID=1656884 RepID=A0A967E8W6_9MICO|nr:NAD(P)-dependent oxidoreductase [Metallococcus carri]NHN54244.1 NAD(P)-dependent oxidoreductase [Metallococcus carri]NOP36916.1 NAD(P)-dependent oxidoreductase [Calidifontibacter sp. DB2511S]
MVDRTPIGVLGLGNMGMPIARRLVAAGHQVIGWDRADRELDGGTIVRSAAEVTGRCATVLYLLPELEMIRPLLADGLLDDAATRTLIVMSTCSPVAITDLAASLADRGIRLIDAPMSGGVTGAEQGRLSIMVGADQADFDAVAPLLAVLGTTVRLLGPVGAGSVAKACNQLVVSATLCALAEATLIAERNGLDRELMLDMLAGGLAASEVLTQKRHALANDDFRPTGPAKFLVKDLRFAEEAGGSLDLPVRSAVAGLFNALTDAGLGDQDNAVVLQHLRDTQPPA